MKNIILWILGGAICVAAAFLIPEQSGSMWTSVIASGIVGVLYLIAFLIVWLKEIHNGKKRKAIVATLTVLCMFSLASAIISYENSMRQREILSDIRTHIESNVIYNHIHEPLIKTLGRYYNDENSEKNIGELFSTEYDSLINKDGVFTYKSQKGDAQTLVLHVSKANADSVVLVGESSYLKGENSSFSNISDHEGRFQVRSVLTKQGVDYERQN